MITPNLSELILRATHLYQAGDLAQAETICRYVLREHGEHPQALSILAFISHAIGAYDFSVNYFERAARANPRDTTTRQNLKKSKEYRKRMASTTKNHSKARPHRFTLIKAWGYGLWSDIDHVMGQLFLSEISGRTPIVHWAGNSLFSDNEEDNAFDYFFEPVSRYCLEDLLGHSYSFFPGKWNESNLRENDVNKWQGPFSRASAIYLLNRTEDAVVSDYHTYIRDLLPWVNRQSKFFNMPALSVYRYIIKKYLRLHPEISESIEQFWRAFIKDKYVVAVHLRGSDKVEEFSLLGEVNADIITELDRHLTQRPDAYVYLATDSINMFEECKRRYGNKLIHSNCARSGDGVGVHHKEHAQRKIIGVEVIKDVYIASKCNYFIGNGRSNVSTCVPLLNEWRDEQYVLFGGNMMLDPHIFVSQHAG